MRIDDNGPKRIGIFGGSFDPVHNGHIALAKAALAQAALDCVIFMPSHIQPFKIGRKAAAGADRVAMLKAAAEGEDRLFVSDYEVLNTDISYTVDTMRAMREVYGRDARLFFILGTDSFLTIDKWRDAEALLTENSFCVGSRPGYRDEELTAFIDSLRERFGTEIVRVMNERIDVSSSEIRADVCLGRPVDGLTPPKTAEYIKQHHLYETDLTDAVRAYIDTMFSEKRRRHTYGVYDEAMKLCDYYGADEDTRRKAKAAALFHDLYRDLNEEDTNALIVKSGIGERYLSNRNVAHGKLAAYAMEHEFGVRDEDTLNAVRYHTTGRAGMSFLEMIIYLADALEPGRDYPGVEELRTYEFTGLENACLASLARTREHIKEKGIVLDPDTEEAVSYFESGKGTRWKTEKEL